MSPLAFWHQLGRLVDLDVELGKDLPGNDALQKELEMDVRALVDRYEALAPRGHRKPTAIPHLHVEPKPE